MTDNVVDAIQNALAPSQSPEAPVIMTVLEIGQFLVDHYDMVGAITSAFRAGATKADIMAGIRSAAVATSDAIMTAELGPRP